MQRLQSMCMMPIIVSFLVDVAAILYNIVKIQIRSLTMYSRRSAHRASPSYCNPSSSIIILRWTKCVCLSVPNAVHDEECSARGARGRGHAGLASAWSSWSGSRGPHCAPAPDCLPATTSPAAAAAAGRCCCFPGRPPSCRRET
jgi:hypothetical protein